MNRMMKLAMAAAVAAGAVFVREGNCISVEVPPHGMLLMVR